MILCKYLMDLQILTLSRRNFINSVVSSRVVMPQSSVIYFYHSLADIPTMVNDVLFTHTKMTSHCCTWRRTLQEVCSYLLLYFFSFGGELHSYMVIIKRIAGNPLATTRQNPGKSVWYWFKCRCRFGLFKSHTYVLVQSHSI